MKLFFFTFFYLWLVRADAQAVKDKDSKLTKTALLTLTIRKSEAGYSISMKNMRVVDGVKKMAPETAGNRQEDELAFFILDKNKNVIDTLSAGHPLQTRYEYPNQDGTISSKIVQLKEKEILLRCPYDPAMKYLQLIKPEANKKLTGLTIIELPEVIN